MDNFEATEKSDNTPSAAHKQGQPQLELKSESDAHQEASVPSVNISSVKKIRWTTLISEHPLEVQAADINHENQPEGSAAASPHKEPLESTTHNIPSQQPPQHSTVLPPESTSMVVHETERIVTTSVTDNVSYQPAPPDGSGELYNIEEILSPPIFTNTSEESGRKGCLKDIFLKFSSPPHINHELTLVVMRRSNIDHLRLAQISPTGWKAMNNIEFDHNAEHVLLIIHSKDGGDEAFLTLTADEIYAMAYAEEDTPAEHVFASESPIGVKMSSTIASSSTLISGVMNTAARLAAFRMRGISSVSPNRDDMPEMSYHLGNLYGNHFERTEDLQDLDFSIYHSKNAVESAPSDHPDLPNWLNNLGISYLHRFERTGDIQNIDCAIAHVRKAVESTPVGNADLLIWFNNLGSLYTCRFECTRDLQDIDFAVSHYKKAIESTPSSHDNPPSSFSHLGDSYARQFECMGDTQDIDCAIAHYQTVTNLTSPWQADLLNQFNNLGVSYLRRFKCTGDLQDINCAISHLQKQAECIPPGHINLFVLISNLGESYYHRYKCTGDPQDIDCAISHLQKTVESMPPGHTDLRKWSHKLGIAYTHRFKRTRNLQDNDCAISYYQKAVESSPSDHANLLGVFNDLGLSYLYCFEYNGDLQDVDCAISHQQKSAESTPPGHANLPSRFNNLGTSYTQRFERTGDLRDIDCAISHQQKTVECTPSGHTDLPRWLNNLGTSYARRFEHTGDLRDIDCAIAHHKKAVESTPSGHTDLPSWSNNLGGSYLNRFARTEDLHDLDCAISHLKEAVELIPSWHADFKCCSNNLGSSYIHRFKYTGDLHDIDCAIFNHQIAIESTPSGHIALPSRFNNLGVSYSHRFESAGDLRDIDYAIAHYQKAVESTPFGHATLPILFKNLGNSYLNRFNNNHYFPDIQSCIAAHRRGAASNGNPSIRLNCAKKAAMTSSVHDRSQCLDDFALATSLLSEVAGLEQTIHRRYANLLGHSDLVTSAVMTALQLNRPDLALEWLEQGRCLVWNQLNQLRTPINDLCMRNPILSDRFMIAASALESYGSRSTLSSTFSHENLREEVRLQNDSQNHNLHAAQYRQLLDEIRTLPGFHNFLRPPKATDILDSLPSDGPVIVFNIHKVRCDALALIASIKEPVHIPLGKFSLEQAKQLQETLRCDLLKQREVEDQDRMMPQRVRRNPASMSFVLKELWCNVVHPILEALGYSSQLNLSDRRRIWWCPTGPLAFLPLHAAGIYDSPHKLGSCISDFAVSSYTLTVQSLNEKSSTSFSIPEYTNFMLICPNTPNIPQIPFTCKEIHDLKALMDQSGKDVTLLEDAMATADKVKTELDNHSWVHFACHGIQDAEDPLKSGVHLYDGRLELLEIIRQKISNPEFAFLSACQTSKGDLELSEEVVHLAAGMLAAGYRGVVGTMWNISDLHGPEFAKWFYQYLLEEEGSKKLDSTRAAYALDYATKKVRETLGEGDAAFLTWVPYVHFGY